MWGKKGRFRVPVDTLQVERTWFRFCDDGNPVPAAAGDDGDIAAAKAAVGRRVTTWIERRDSGEETRWFRKGVPRANDLLQPRRRPRHKLVAAQTNANAPYLRLVPRNRGGLTVRGEGAMTGRHTHSTTTDARRPDSRLPASRPTNVTATPERQPPTPLQRYRPSFDHRCPDCRLATDRFSIFFPRENTNLRDIVATNVTR